jgi:hypothetical protein
MKGDFSRWTFDSTKRYDRVLSLQGRVFLDADFNEGMELQLQRLRRLTVDLLGPHAGPGSSFDIVKHDTEKDFYVTSGSYYVNGILCENPVLPPPKEGGQADPGPKYTEQPFLPNPPDLEDGQAIVYLDVWERFLTYLEDEDRDDDLQQSIREVALRGTDTAARSQVVWQLRLIPLEGAAAPANNKVAFDALIKRLTDDGTIRTVNAGSNRFGMVKMRARKPKADDLPCATSPYSRYRGPENQLYRVEIHLGGTFPVPPNSKKGPTFKWSRENGSVVFPIRSVKGQTVVLDTLGHDDRLGLKPGDWVEVVDDEYVLNNRAEPLLKVESVDREASTVELSAAPQAPVGTVPALHPILRRWDGTGPVSINPDPGSDGYLALEDGVEVHFSKGVYRTSDYWIAPARTATGDVEWPGTIDKPQEVPPHGIAHAYAPLAVITVAAGSVSVDKDLRRTIKELWS